MKSLYAGNPKSPAAICPYHQCYLTVKEMKKHDCLKKQCSYLQRIEGHSYWVQRDVAKKKRKSRKEAFEARIGR